MCAGVVFVACWGYLLYLPHCIYLSFYMSFTVWVWVWALQVGGE